MYIRLLICFLGVMFQATAQTGKVISANAHFNEFNQNGDINSLNKAKTYIEEAIVEPKGAAHPRTWFVRGTIYLVGAQKANNGKFKDLDQLNIAYESFKKSLEVEGKYSERDQAMLYLKQIGFDYYNEGVNYSQALNYLKAYECFAQVEDVMNYLERNKESLSYVDKKDNTKSEVLRPDLVNAMCAMAKKAGMIDRAIELFNKAIELNPSPDLYRNLASCYIEKKELDKSMEVLERGLKAYPDNINILLDQLNMYIKMNKKDEAIEKFKKAIEMDPNNASLYAVLASIYFDMAKYEEAKLNYEKVLSITPNDFNANYNLAVLYNTKANEIIKRINALGISEADNRKAETLRVERDRYYNLAKPYLEKCSSIRPDDEEVKRIINKMVETMKN